MQSSNLDFWLPECEKCLFNTHNPHLPCTVHATGVTGNSCLDFRPDHRAEPQELWEPEGAGFYDGELILQPAMVRSERQLELLNWHPLFTGRCPNCETPIACTEPPVHWDCSHCGWLDDTV
jgi:hypothetical protein